MSPSAAFVASDEPLPTSFMCPTYTPTSRPAAVVPSVKLSTSPNVVVAGLTRWFGTIVPSAFNAILSIASFENMIPSASVRAFGLAATANLPVPVVPAAAIENTPVVACACKSKPFVHTWLLFAVTLFSPQFGPTLKTSPAAIAELWIEVGTESEAGCC